MCLGIPPHLAFNGAVTRAPRPTAAGPSTARRSFPAAPGFPCRCQGRLRTSLSRSRACARSIPKTARCGIGGADPRRPCSVGLSPSKKTQSPLSYSIRLLRTPTCAHVVLFEVLDRQVEAAGQGGNLFLVHPHVTGRAGAAIAALRALESQSVAVPGFFCHVRISSNCDTHQCTPSIARRRQGVS